MPNFPSIEKNDRLALALAKFNTGVEKPLMLLMEALMRNEDSPFSLAERELFAAYVSGVMDDCGYCANIHILIAKRFGVKEGLLEELLADIDTADIDDNFKPLFHYMKKLTLHPTKMIPGDSQAVFNAGWSERALYDVLMICSTWNFLNRLVEGLGLEVDHDQYKLAAQILVEGYMPVIDKMKLK